MPKPVLVVGAGPVGLTMAVELARYGIPVRIVDKAPARTDKSKALGVWARTLELLERAGCAEAFTAAGLKVAAAAIRSGERVIARVPFGAIASPFPGLLIIPQSESERLLDEHLRTFGGSVERDVELAAFAEAGDGVSCTLRHADGRSETVEASWLIGCDGARSFVRHALGKAFEGDTLSTTFVLADVQVAGLDIPGDELSIFWHEDGIVVFFPISPGRYRVVADAGTAPRQDPTLADIQAMVARRVDGAARLSDPVWLAGFAVNERKVRDYRAGRVFLAGDAAHIHSPAGGQGMNTGMQDAFNLAWKLALVEEGRADATLLDSYSVERSVVAERILSDSGRITRVATLSNRLLQAVRDVVAGHVLGLSFVRKAVADRLSEITIGYPDSPLNAGVALGSVRPGQRIVTDRPFGAGGTPLFALLARYDDAARSVLGRHASLLEPELRPPAAEGILLVRPDGYVAAVARAGDWATIEGALARIAGGTKRPAAV